MPQKPADEQRNVFLSIAQRWHGDAHDIQAKEKIVAKFSLAHERLEILVCGRDQPHISPQRLISAHSLEGALLADYAQQLDLGAWTDLGYFVEENRAAVRLFKPANPAFVRASERTYLVSEQLALDQL